MAPNVRTHCYRSVCTYGETLTFQAPVDFSRPRHSVESPGSDKIQTVTAVPLPGYLTLEVTSGTDRVTQTPSTDQAIHNPERTRLARALSPYD